MSRFGRLWLFFCLLRGAASVRNLTAPFFPHASGSADCDPDISLLYDAKWHFVVSGTCQLLVNSYRLINVSEIWLSDNRLHGKFHFCTLLRPSVFPVSSSELGTLLRTKLNDASFNTLKLEEWPETVAAADLMRPGHTLQIHPTEKTCHFHKAKKILRCLSLIEEKGQKFIQYTDYEGDEQNMIRPFRRKKWPIPPSANIKGREVLSYYDDYTQSGRIWMEHNLQWLYNLDMDEQDERGNKTTRLTTYHLSNRDANRPFMVPVYSDANGLVTAHCVRVGFDCRYIYNRVDAKSAMDGTCILHLPYLTVVGLVTPPKGMAIDQPPDPPMPEALVQEDETAKELEGPPGLDPIYWLIVFTFIFILSMLVVRFQSLPPEDMMPLYDSLGEDIGQWAAEFRVFMREKKVDEPTKKPKSPAAKKAKPPPAVPVGAAPKSAEPVPNR